MKNPGLIISIMFVGFYNLGFQHGKASTNEVDLGKLDDIGTPSDNPGVYNLSGTPLPTVMRRRPSPPIALDLDEPYGDSAPLTIDKAGRLLGECIPTNKKLKVGPYARMFFKINDINYLCEKE